MACLGLVFSSCSEGDETVDQVLEETTRGAVLRQIAIMPADFDGFLINNVTGELVGGESYGVTHEFQDATNGSSLSTMNVYLSYGGGEESLIDSVPASSFTTSSRGLPEYTYSTDIAAMQSALGLSSSDLVGTGGSNFDLRFEAVLNDGRTFSNNNNTGTITGSYYASPFLYRLPTVCGPAAPAAGTWTVEAGDTYGDGWNGASISYFFDGTEDGSVTLESGSAEELTFTVPDGTDMIELVYNEGPWDVEVFYTITSANGNVVSTAGPGVSAGTILLDFCAF